jgi:hypothetical protein
MPCSSFQAMMPIETRGAADVKSSLFTTKSS